MSKGQVLSVEAVKELVVYFIGRGWVHDGHGEAEEVGHIVVQENSAVNDVIGEERA